MITPTKPTTRTCTACGQVKPLVAFLELAGAHGHSYGNICSTCRGSNSAQKSTIENSEPGDKSGGSTRFQLDNKARMQTEVEKEDLFKHQNDLVQDEKAKKDQLAENTSAQTEQKEKIDKKYREDYLQSQEQQATTKTKKQPTGSFLDRQKQGAQAYTQEKLWVEKGQIVVATENLQTSNKTEVQKTAADVSTIDLGEPSKMIGRSAESIFGRFRDYLGKSAAINRTLAQYEKKTEQPAAKQAPLSSKQTPSFLKTTAKEIVDKSAEKNIVTDYVNKNIKRK
jgi:hypothetical protein